MNSINTIRSMVNGAHETLDLVLRDLPTTLVNKTQPGSANTIGAIYAHAVIDLDIFYNVAIQDKKQVLVASRFADKLGVQDPTQLNWETLHSISWDLAVLQTYTQAVFASVNGYLTTLTDEELGRACQVFGNDTTVEQAIAIATWHTALHAGEIAALKGVNNVLGLPF